MSQSGQPLKLLLCLPLLRLPSRGGCRVLGPFEPFHGNGQPIVQNGPVVLPMGIGPQKLIFVSEGEMEGFGVDYWGEYDRAFENWGSV